MAKSVVPAHGSPGYGSTLYVSMSPSCSVGQAGAGQSHKHMKNRAAEVQDITLGNAFYPVHNLEFSSRRWQQYSALVL